MIPAGHFTEVVIGTALIFNVTFEVVLCGRALERTTFLKDLLLGPTTSLIVFVDKRPSPTSPTTSAEGDAPLARNTPEIGSFYCFLECLTFALKEQRFVFRPTFGYTITCPHPGCERCVTDMHHFRILGDDKYQLYQRIAAEKLIELDDRGVFCPYPDCNSSFFWETEDDDGKTSCPDCLRLFCRLCKSADCICGVEDPTTVTIQATT
ncbi:hypothetical protein GCK32_011436, partial [Trichostrongylus colubriformis]